MNIPAYFQSDIDALTDTQRQIFFNLLAASSAGSPGNMIVSDAAVQKTLEHVKRMGPEPEIPQGSTEIVNDWGQKLK